MTNPEEVDDCMQAGHFKVWKQLQARRDLPAGKPRDHAESSSLRWTRQALFLQFTGFTGWTGPTLTVVHY